MYNRDLITVIIIGTIPDSIVYGIIGMIIALKTIKDSNIPEAHDELGFWNYQSYKKILKDNTALFRSGFHCMLKLESY